MIRLSNAQIAYLRLLDPRIARPKAAQTPGKQIKELFELGMIAEHPPTYPQKPYCQRWWTITETGQTALDSLPKKEEAMK